jgi:NAD(P)-dependent dehydrogenase (short-subunit alcohol dehydrogenase family)
MDSAPPAKRPCTGVPEAAAPVPATTGSPRRLAGKIILCTGGTQGCGECILHACADEGASGLVFCGRQESLGQAVQEALEAKGCQALYVRADLAVAADVATVLAAADKKFGRLDGLVNAAASTERGDWVGSNKASLDHLDRLYALNFRAPFLLLQGAAEIMIRESSGGSIVNIGSINGHGGQSDLPMYSCTKGALTTMTKHAAWSLRKERIRTNYIAVGWMFTPAEHKMMTGFGKRPATWIDDADKGHPFGRILRPADVAKLVVHLLSDDASMQSGSVIDLHENFGLCCWDGQGEVQ